jgi:hypothetical protein
MKKIHETIFILHKCYLNVKIVWAAIEKYQQKGPLYSVHHFTNNLTHYLILETVSFLKEYEGYFNAKEMEQEYGDKILIVRKICDPILKRINKWESLNDFRNNIVAHPWRNKKKFVVPLNKKYNIPRTWFEFQYLKDLISYIDMLIQIEFEKEFGEALFYGQNLNENVQTIISMEKANIEVKNMVEEMNVLAKNLGKEYDLKIFYYTNEQ